MIADEHTCSPNEERVDVAVDQELLDMLLCPKCKGDVRLNAAGDGVICESCSLLYEVREDVPIMLVVEAKTTKPGQTVCSDSAPA